MYATQHRKTTTMSLERALQSAKRELWDHYCSETIEKLGAHGLPQVAQRLMKVCMQERGSSSATIADWASEREYLTLVFFDLWMGRGLLEEFSLRASVMMSAPPAARAMRLQLHLTPVPGVLAAHPAAGGLFGGGRPTRAVAPLRHPTPIPPPHPPI